MIEKRDGKTYLDGTEIDEADLAFWESIPTEFLDDDPYTEIDGCPHDRTEDLGGDIVCLQCGMTLEEKE